MHVRPSRQEEVEAAEVEESGAFAKRWRLREPRLAHVHRPDPAIGAFGRFVGGVEDDRIDGFPRGVVGSSWRSPRPRQAAPSARPSRATGAIRPVPNSGAGSVQRFAVASSAPKAPGGPARARAKPRDGQLLAAQLAAPAFPPTPLWCRPESRCLPSRAPGAQARRTLSTASPKVAWQRSSPSSPPFQPHHSHCGRCCDSPPAHTHDSTSAVP